MRIGIDMDGVVIDTINFVAKELSKYLKCEVKPDNVAHNIGKIDGINEIFKDRGDYLLCSLDPIECVVDSINRIAKNHDVYIISSRFQMHYDITMEWIKRHDINVNKVIFTEGKGKVDVCKKNEIDIFIEDSVINATELVDNGVKVIIYSTEYNACLEREDIIRCDNWTSIVRTINEVEQKEKV